MEYIWKIFDNFLNFYNPLIMNINRKKMIKIHDLYSWLVFERIYTIFI